MSEIIYAGIIPQTPGYNWDNVAYGYCNDPNGANIGLNNPQQAPPNTDTCTANYLDSTNLRLDWSNNCQTFSSCTFNPVKYVLTNTGIPDTFNCLTDPAKVYIQYKCT